MSMSITCRIPNNTYSTVFAVGNFRYTITDDCMISKTSTNSVISLLQKLGSNRSGLVEKKVEVNSFHILHLLKCCLASHDTVLTDTFLTNGKAISTLQREADFFPGTQRSSSPSPGAINLKLAINKRDKTVIFAEDNSEFTDLLFSFLCLPVGCIVELFEGHINFGCFQNIYKSVDVLHLADCFISIEMENMLMCPKSLPFSSIKNVQLMQVEESEPETLFVCSKFPSCNTNIGELAIGYKTCVCGKSADVPVSLQDPKQCSASKPTAGFLISSAYVVADNLSIKSLSCISVASFYLDGAVDGGVEFITVDVGPQQALALLKASITSKTALTDALLRSKETSNVVKTEAAC